MSYKMILRTTGAIMLIEAAVMVLMTLVSLIYRENPVPFLITIVILLVLGFPLSRMKLEQKSFFAKEGYVTAAITKTATAANLFQSVNFFSDIYIIYSSIRFLKSSAAHSAFMR